MRLIDADELLSEEILSICPAFDEKMADITDLKDIVSACATIQEVPNCYFVKSSFDSKEKERLLDILKRHSHISISSDDCICDTVSVVRCKDCKHRYGTQGQPNILCGNMKDNDFCSYGEKKA